MVYTFTSGRLLTGWAISGRAGSGQTYKLRQRDSGIVTGQPSAVWFDGLDIFVTPTANSFSDAAGVTAPASVVYRPARSDSGTYWAVADIMVGANSGIWYLENQSGDPLATCSEAIIVSSGTQAGWSE